MAGASAGAVSQALIYPLEITKTRLALSTTGDESEICVNIELEIADSIIAPAKCPCLIAVLCCSFDGFVVILAW